MPSIAANNAVTQIARQLGSEALRDGVSKQELQQIVADGVQDLSPAQKREVIDQLEAELPRFGDQYFASVFGVEKEALLQTLETAARPAGGNGALAYLNAQAQVDSGKKSVSPDTLSALKTAAIQELPYPAVEANVVGILSRDPTIASLGLDAAGLKDLAQKLLTFGDEPIESRLDAYLNPAPARKSVSADTLQKIEEYAFLSLPYPIVEAKVAEYLAADPTIAALKLDPVELQELSASLLKFGDVPLADRLLAYLNPPADAAAPAAVSADTLQKIEEYAFLSLPYPIVEAKVAEYLAADPAIAALALDDAALKQLSADVLKFGPTPIPDRLAAFLAEQ